MLKDIYNRNSDDPNYVYGVLEHTDPIESIISKIKMILSTKPGQVIGESGFGVYIEDIVFETRINKMQLEETIKRQINTYVSEASEYKITPEVSFGKADGYDYCVIDIYINDTKTFGISVT